MRISSIRAMLILACAALVVTAGACQACAAFLNLLPDNIFAGSGAQQVQPAGISHNNFFSMAIGMIPASDETSREQMSGMLGIKNSYDSTNIRLPLFASNESWMTGFMTLGTPVDISNSAARASYGQLIKSFDNQSDIFTY
jgi:hypothetical protein